MDMTYDWATNSRLRKHQKSWENEKIEYRKLKRGDRNDLLRKGLKEIFESSKVRTYHYKNLRSFSLGLGMEGHSILSGGDLPMDSFRSMNPRTSPSAWPP
jgi:hypothetical protein